MKNKSRQTPAILVFSKQIISFHLIKVFFILKELGLEIMWRITITKENDTLKGEKFLLC